MPEIILFATHCTPGEITVSKIGLWVLDGVDETGMGDVDVTTELLLCWGMVGLDLLIVDLEIFDWLALFEAMELLHPILLL